MIKGIGRAAGLAMLLSVVGLGQSAFAYTACGGPLDWVAVIPDGRVAVQQSSAQMTTVYVCQIGGTYNGIGPDACKAILSLLLSAYTSGKTVSWFFSDPNTCANQSAYQPMVGMYWGPVIEN